MAFLPPTWTAVDTFLFSLQQTLKQRRVYGGCSPAFRGRMTCVSPRTYEVWFAALAPLEMPHQLPDGRQTRGSHASMMKLGEVGLWQRFPVLLCALQAFFFSHLFLCYAVLPCRLCWSGCLVNKISEIIMFKKIMNPPPQTETAIITPLRLITLPLPRCLLRADFKHGNAGAVSEAQSASDLTGVLGVMCYKQKGRREEPRPHRQRAHNYFCRQETLPDPIVWTWMCFWEVANLS